MLNIKKIGHAGCYYFYEINGEVYGTTQTSGNEWTFTKQNVTYDSWFGTMYQNTNETLKITLN